MEGPHRVEVEIWRLNLEVPGRLPWLYELTSNLERFAEKWFRAGGKRAKKGRREHRWERSPRSAYDINGGIWLRYPETRIDRHVHDTRCVRRPQPQRTAPILSGGSVTSNDREERWRGKDQDDEIATTMRTLESHFYPSLR